MPKSPGIHRIYHIQNAVFILLDICCFDLFVTEKWHAVVFWMLFNVYEMF